MITKIEIDIQERWHVGSGFGDGPKINALVVRTSEGLPYLPGKTLKGLMRDACRLVEDLKHLEEGSTDQLFGSANGQKEDPGMNRFHTTSGSLDIRTAFLGKDETERRRWKNWASSSTKQQADSNPSLLFDLLHSTAIEKENIEKKDGTLVEKKGVAKEGSLRTFEFAVPMKLYAEIEGKEDDLKLLSTFLPMIRELGTRRRRGFGRCAVSVVKEGVVK